MKYQRFRGEIDYSEPSETQKEVIDYALDLSTEHMLLEDLSGAVGHFCSVEAVHEAIDAGRRILDVMLWRGWVRLEWARLIGNQVDNHLVSEADYERVLQDDSLWTDRKWERGEWCVFIVHCDEPLPASHEETVQ